MNGGDKTVKLADANSNLVLTMESNLRRAAARMMVLLGMLLPAQEAFSQDESLFTSDWRDPATGDWLMGFRPEGVVYDCRVWDYRTKVPEGDGWALLLESGGETLQVKVGREEDGRRSIAVDGHPATVCEKLSGRVMPDYPTADGRGLTDNGYRVDSVTVCGWYVNRPAKLQGKGQTFEVTYTDVLTAKGRTVTAPLDSLGRFRVTFPVLNTQEVFLDWRRIAVHTVVEPGETYFLLCDFGSGRRLFMGRDSRLPNELLAHETSFRSPLYQDPREQKMSLEELMVLGDKVLAQREALLDSLTGCHPTLSERYRAYFRGNVLMDNARNIGQARFFSPDFRLPRTVSDHLAERYWSRMPQPYTVHAQAFASFVCDFLDDRMEYCGLRASVRPDELVCEGFIRASEEKRQLMEAYGVAFRGLEAALAKEADEALRDSLVHRFRREQAEALAYLDVLMDDEEAGAVVRRELTRRALASRCTLLDTLGCTGALRDICLTNFFHAYLDNNRHSLPQELLTSVEELIGMESARDLLHAEQAHYVALEESPVPDAESLKSADVVAGLTDGGEILDRLLAPYRGKPVLIDVWGTWCGPCKEALSHSQELYEALAPYGVVCLYLANNSPVESWRNVIREYRLTGSHCAHYNLPPEQQAAVESVLGVRSYPTYRLADRTGRVLDVPADPRRLAELLESVKGVAGQE